MISFALEEDQQIIQETVKKFAAEVMRPKMRAWEKARAVPAEARRTFHEMGLGLLDVPEALGGAGASATTAAVVHEEMAAGDPGAAVALWAPHLVPAAILELGDEAQARKFLARFADPKGAERLGAVAYSERKGPVAGFSTVAEKKGNQWVLRGSKAFVVNGGRADLTVVFAQIEPDKGWDGIGAFVVEAGTAGISEIARHALLGLETVYAAEIALDGVTVPDENRLTGGKLGFAAGAKRFFQRAALTNAARQVGLARAAYETALEYTQERTAFGKPVAHFQAIAFTLAEMHMDVEAARWMVWRAAAGFGVSDKPDGRDVAQAAVHANEAAWRVADNAVQLLGGAGFVQDFPVEKWMRDTKALALFSPADQLSQLALAQLELGHPIEAGWPSSAIQPIFT
jgi:alkylation response protein AidB-like acyl-CoA dehydrogenase